MLKEFSQMVGAAGGDTKTPPFVIRASDLDSNFAHCNLLPIDGNNAPYRIVRSSTKGYTLQGTVSVDVCENGKPARFLFFGQKQIEGNAV